MDSRLIRVLLVVIAVAIGFAASYFLKDVENDLIAQRSAMDALRDRAKSLTATIADVRAGQVAYVARGQGEAFWMTHVSALKPSLEKQAAELSAILTAPAAQAAFEPAAAALENFQKLDSRVQDYVNGGNPLLAADLIFSDGLEATGTATTQLGTALNEELQARQNGMAVLRTRQLAIVGSAAGGILVLLLILAFTGSAPRQAEEPDASAEPSQQPPVMLDHPVTPNLAKAAQLCTDFGRVFETRQLPALLERTAKVIEASGIIVWMADPTGQELRPALSHGYSDHIIARMGSIPRDAINATASAYRSAEMRTVAGDDFTNGAVVAPLMTSGGCIGVLSAEMKGGSEASEGSQALAAIFAAQLATLVAPPASAALDRAAAQG